MTRSVRETLRGAVALALCANVVGCAAPGRIESTRPAHVIVLPGIGGWDPFIDAIARRIAREVPNTSAQLWDWTRIEPQFSFDNLHNLTNLERNLRRAKQLAGQLETWRVNHPTTRISILAFSGGAGIAAFTCEALPADFRFDRIVLVSGGLSPGYDLTPVLRRTERGLFNYYSSEDRYVLRDLTRLHGTMDRKNSDSCGLTPFKRPADTQLAAKLRQLEWRPEMKKLGNDGGHVGGLATPFLRDYVFPLLDPTHDRIPAGWR
ncbi:MAG: hypothetical protein L6Q92_08715 [Phycisphaerae bacterium]|nr:hypothetical protein [Phycisphaerae bacterium]